MTRADPPSERADRLARGPTLLTWARTRLLQKLGGPPASRPEAPWCSELGATFVTLHWKGGRLQGCIGSIEPRFPIVDDVEHNVIAAACHDPRGRLLELADAASLDIELSILSPLEPIAFVDEASALAAIRPGLDGVVLGWQGERATFLPAMWSRLPDVHEFMQALKIKGGLPRDFWRADVKLWRYAVDSYSE